jgi:hypothetical protein
VRRRLLGESLSLRRYFEHTKLASLPHIDWEKKSPQRLLAPRTTPRDGGHRTRLGHFPARSLKDARTEARTKLSEPLQNSAAAANVAAADALILFLANHETKTRPRTHREVELLLNKHLLPILRGPVWI